MLNPIVTLRGFAFSIAIGDDVSELVFSFLFSSAKK